MMPYTELFERLGETPFAAWGETLPAQIQAALADDRHGDLARWRAALARLPSVQPCAVNLNADCLSIGGPQDMEAATRQQLIETLSEFHPWRKGPFCIHGVHIDTEWRSDWKWQRVAPHIAALPGRRVLDVGCGNGYYGWRMVGSGADLVIGVDPTLVFVMQYLAVRQLVGSVPNYVLPLGLEALPDTLTGFDTVFSMGVLYHRRDPLEHLRRLRRLLRNKGELVLETLIVPGEQAHALEPQGRYAKMRNVFAIPSVPLLQNWLEDSGFSNVRCVDVTRTSLEEQRATAWMRFESLADFLHPQRRELTIEGHPAPSRAVMVCNA